MEETKFKSVLVVEDEPMVGKLIGDILSMSSLRPLIAGDGQAACEMMQRHPDTTLALVDFYLPGVNGNEIARRLRQAYPHIKFLFMTGWNESLITEGFDLKPCDSIIVKPFTCSDLRKKVMSFFVSDPVQI